MERVVLEGEVATANTLSRVLSALPRIGSPARVMFYDLHTLQNRFYFHTGAIATMHTAIPLVSAACAYIYNDACSAQCALACCAASLLISLSLSLGHHLGEQACRHVHDDRHQRVIVPCI